MPSSVSRAVRAVVARGTGDGQPPGRRRDGDRFVGRAAELGQVRELAAAAGGARSALVGGPPGIGKTAFLRRVADDLTGFTVLWAVGDSWEREVPYGLVSQLVAPARVERGADHPTLFAPGLTDRPPHDVGAAMVALLDELVEQRPVAIVVDDVPFADPLSLRAVAFAARRLRHAPVLLLASARTGGPDSDTAWRLLLPTDPVEVALGELEPDDVAALARAHGVPWLPAARQEWLARHTGGHPLYLARLLDDTDPARLVSGVDEPLPVPRAVVAAIGRQTAALPADSARLLEAIAVLGGRRPLAVVAELAGVARPDEALEPLLAANLARSWPQLPQAPVAVRHPIQRDAVYEAIMPNRRRALHAAALGHSRGGAAWAHRVAASDSMDPRLATDLETAAGDVLVDGGPDRAATFLLWSADLSADPSDRERRVLHAAAHLLWNHRYAQADALRPEVENATDSPLRSCILGRFAMQRGWYAAAEAGFRGALADPAAGDVVRLLATTGLAALWCWLGRGAEATVVAHEALAIPGGRSDLVVLARQCLVTATLLTDGPAAALTELEARLDRREIHAHGAHAKALALRSLVRGLAGDATAAVDDAESALRLTRSGSVTEVDISPQHCLAWAQYLLGQWDDAAANAEHAFALAVAEGKTWATTQGRMVAALIAAGRGDWETADAAAADTVRWVRILGPPQHVVFSAMATAAVAAARGEHAAVLRALRPLTTLPDVTGWVLAYEPWWRVAAAEAAIATGDLALAATTIARVTDLSARQPALATACVWLTAQLTAARGDEQAALRLLATAVEERDDTAGVLPLHAAQLDEAHGRLLLRDRRWRTGLRSLRHAHHVYTAMGAAPAAERCAALLAASGMRADGSDDGPLTLLTERERAIAELVARGLTNHEVGVRLFISSKTVAHHLARIYPKLGVTSRRELRGLAGAEDTAGGAPPVTPRPRRPS